MPILPKGREVAEAEALPEEAEAKEGVADQGRLWIERTEFRLKSFNQEFH